MNHVYAVIRSITLAIIVLLASQINVGGKRICDHVGDITKSSAIQKPLAFLSSHINVVGSGQKNQKGKAHAIQQPSTRTTDNFHSDSAQADTAQNDDTSIE